MRKPQFVVILATALALTFSTAQFASGEDAGKAINYYDYLFQSKPEGMFYPRDTLIGFTSSAARFSGRTTTKGPDNVWTTVFQPCSKEIPEYCIESVEWRKIGSTQWKKGTVTDWKPNPSDPWLTGTTFTDVGETQYRDFFINSDTGLPRGGLAKVWNLDGATHGGGSNYLVTASVDYYKFTGTTTTPIVFATSINPVKFDQTSPQPRGMWPFTYGDEYNFPTDIEFQLKVRTGNFKEQIGGWFNGRIQDPSISQDGGTLTLSGAPTRVLAARTGPISCENSKLTAYFAERCANKDPSLASQFYVGVQTLSSSIEAVTTPTILYPNGSFAYYEPILKPMGFTSEWNSYAWGVNGSGNCEIDAGKIALVTSNATVYSVNPPAWDPAEQSLAYKVGSLHLDDKGALHKGYFNLAVPKTFAKCLWGENILNAKATVAVTNADGTNNVATSVLSQDDQMIYFKVAGFTFSTPQIKLKLEVPKVEPTPIPTPSATATPMAKPVVKKLTIACVKGKVIKKVTAVAPKCPSGYKKR